MKAISTKLAQWVYLQIDPNQKKIQQVEDLFNFLTERIALKFPESAKLISDYKNSEQQLRFFKLDKEMCIKFPDIWKMQMDLEETNLENIKHHLIKNDADNHLKISEFFATIEKENSNLSDLFD
jgi:hypothetical protein